jgi:hypothetical protein
MNDDQIESMEVLKLLVDFDRDHPGFLKDFFAALEKDPQKMMAAIHEAAKVLELD